MNRAVTDLSTAIFETSQSSFSDLCMEVFRFQYEGNPVYRQYCDMLKKAPGSVMQVNDIPFLPISLFKKFRITTTDFEPRAVFESSGTKGLETSRHYVKDTGLYEKSFLSAFNLVYGDPRQYCFLALLPSYLERGNSSLVYMVNTLCEHSQFKQSGFYLHNYGDLADVLEKNAANGIRTLLIGVTYALLDFAAEFPMNLNEVIVMETGGMKGRKKEMLRSTVHETLMKNWQLRAVHSEYGMTELLSQAYSTSGGIFEPPPWMKVVCRQEDDPFHVSNLDEAATGVANIIDLANLYSCSFIATDDLVQCDGKGNFSIEGRLDHSDLRGCSLLFSP